ncbi:hypothetical protein SKAU_G00148120 [Synaphobranchus kaupii]|uniref:Translin-associated protein X n=1 Tax=Synaphobranchus kaupii TaxID=118154 RepID=A0A9Q1FTI6_SYNKA|nr:hypothetical protein SKAU_G00148120 [Synaphobranchus kaupii]
MQLANVYDAAQTPKTGDPSSEVNPSAVLSAFKTFQLELDCKHDKYERLVKLSRDITIESKRTIFLLHRVTSVPNVEEVLAEAEAKLDGVRLKISQIAEELRGEDLFQFHRAFTPGIQEYVEAVSFQHFIRNRCLITLEEVNSKLVFVKEDRTDAKDSSVDQQGAALSFQVTPTDYLLGVADLTGELMRMCINSVGNGDMDTPFQLGQFLREIHDGFAYIGNTGPYEVSKKLYTLKQSLGKVEDACYALRVRGSEIPKHMLADSSLGVPCFEGYEPDRSELFSGDELIMKVLSKLKWTFSLKTTAPLDTPHPPSLKTPGHTPPQTIARATSAQVIHRKDCNHGYRRLEPQQPIPIQRGVASISSLILTCRHDAIVLRKGEVVCSLDLKSSTSFIASTGASVIPMTAIDYSPAVLEVQ